MKRVNWFSLVCLLLFGVSGCTPKVSITPTAVDDTVGLIQYVTITLTPTITPTPENAPTATLAPTATPTPRVYTVKASDTLIVIAYKNGLTLDELTAANPDVDPYLLRPGMTLFLPAPSGSAGTQSAPAPTPIAISIKTPTCTEAITGGLYCFALATNEQDFDLGNITAEFQLINPANGEAVTHMALLPLRQLIRGMSVPFFAYIAPPIFADPIVSLQLKTALQANLTSPTVIIQEPDIRIAPDGLSATISGTVQLEAGATKGSRLWIAAIALNSFSEVVGIRRSEITQIVNPGESVGFTLTVYSTGGKIAKVELYGELGN
jgi:hypothetical protein